jgi:hypothetical protein
MMQQDATATSRRMVCSCCHACGVRVLSMGNLLATRLHVLPSTKILFQRSEVLLTRRSQTGVLCWCCEDPNVGSKSNGYLVVVSAPEEELRDDAIYGVGQNSASTMSLSPITSFLFGQQTDLPTSQSDLLQLFSTRQRQKSLPELQMATFGPVRGQDLSTSLSSSSPSPFDDDDKESASRQMLLSPHP